MTQILISGFPCRTNTIYVEWSSAQRSKAVKCGLFSLLPLVVRRTVASLVVVMQQNNRILSHYSWLASRDPVISHQSVTFTRDDLLPPFSNNPSPHLRLCSQWPSIRVHETRKNRFPIHRIKVAFAAAAIAYLIKSRHFTWL